MRKLLLLTSLVLLSIAAAAQNTPLTQGEAPNGQNLLADNAHVSDAVPPLDRSGWSTNEGQMDDDICYRIRAYIFKRDDDHPPKLVGSTTCGPRQPRARSAALPGAHLELLK